MRFGRSTVEFIMLILFTVIHIVHQSQFIDTRVVNKPNNGCLDVPLGIDECNGLLTFLIPIQTTNQMATLCYVEFFILQTV